MAKMKTKVKKLKITTILAVIALTFCALGLAGCSDAFSPYRKGYTAKVVYDFNGDDHTELGIRTFYYMPDSPIIKPEASKSATIDIPSLAGSHVNDWYVAEVDDNGEPVKNAEGKFNLSEEPWDFSEGKSGAKDSVLYLVAEWAKNYVLTVDVGDEARAQGVENKVDTSYAKPGSISKPGGSVPKWKGHTFHYYYRDKDDDTSRIHDEDWENIVIDDENPEITIYVKWLEGNWTVVTDSTQMSTLSANMNYLLEADIDFADSEGKKTAISGASMYVGTFDGNGHTIKNFKSTVQATGNAADQIGLFASFGKGGCVKNVTFENCVVEVNLMARQEHENYKVGFLCGDLFSRTDSSAFTDIKFVGCELNIYQRSYAENYTITLGDANYFGVFGNVGDGNFSIADADRGITVKINDVIQTLG